MACSLLWAAITTELYQPRPVLASRSRTLAVYCVTAATSGNAIAHWDYYLRQGGYVFVVVCLLTTLRKKTSERICMKFSGKVASEELITFCVSRRRRKMYCGHARLCVCVCVCLSADACLQYCTDPNVT